VSIAGEQTHSLAGKQGGAVDEIPQAQGAGTPLQAEVKDDIDTGAQTEEG
jgi:hypothetical protein